ncbi:MAG: XisI protein [Chitinophagales bacterium]|jgi:hypothetical protein|nr:XisI protein [Chitinophagales bacterium]HNI44012.1 XisI protein [Chitinophagales bacterium]
MDKITQYQKIICQILEKYASIKKVVTPDVKAQLIIDTNNLHYQLLSTGWHKNRYIYTVAFHFAIKNEKVWILQNNTEAMIADELYEQGIPKSDIILGFVPAKGRVYTGFGIE